MLLAARRPTGFARVERPEVQRLPAMGSACSTGRPQSRAAAASNGSAPGAAAGPSAAASASSAAAAGDGHEHVDGCVFCQIVRGQRPANVVMRTERLIVFQDKSPAAAAHLQVVPLTHIHHFGALKPCQADFELVEEMRRTGQAALEQLCPGAPQRFGFHKPPWYSVEHLHLHALALPFRPMAPTWKYADSSFAVWWLSVEDALSQLQPPARTR